jgi:5-methylcytosine-specific restriction endonuclease McrA
MPKTWDAGSTRSWRVLRDRVLNRDGHCCQRCGQGEGKLHVDHIVPKRLGGSDLMENLQTLCQMCNLSKGGRFFGEGGTPPTLHVPFVPQNVSISHDQA